MSSVSPKRSRRGLRMVLALVLAGTAAGGVYLYAGSVQREAAQQRQVELASATPAPAITLAPAVVARADVKAHTALTADAFEVKQLPREAVAPNAVVSLDSLAGKVLDAPITAGEQLTSNRLIDAQADDPATFADIIPPGLRAMSLTFTELGGAAGLIVPGNHVDVVAVFKKD